VIRDRAGYFGYFHNFMPVGFYRIDIALICSELKQCRKNSNMGPWRAVLYQTQNGQGRFFFGHKGLRLQDSGQLIRGVGYIILGLNVVFLELFPAIRSNLLRRTPAQKDFRCYRGWGCRPYFALENCKIEFNCRISNLQTVQK
jgi:hypothetical protein